MHGQHCNVAIEPFHGSRLGQNAFESPAASDLDLCADDSLHRMFRRVPGPAAAAPPGVIVHVHLQPQPVRLGQRVLEQLSPLGTQEFNRPFRDAA